MEWSGMNLWNSKNSDTQISIWVISDNMLGILCTVIPVEIVNFFWKKLTKLINLYFFQKILTICIKNKLYCQNSTQECNLHVDNNSIENFDTMIKLKINWKYLFVNSITNNYYIIYMYFSSFIWNNIKFKLFLHIKKNSLNWQFQFY